MDTDKTTTCTCGDGTPTDSGTSTCICTYTVRTQPDKDAVAEDAKTAAEQERIRKMREGWKLQRKQDRLKGRKHGN